MEISHISARQIKFQDFTSVWYPNQIKLSGGELPQIKSKILNLVLNDLKKDRHRPKARRNRPRRFRKSTSVGSQNFNGSWPRSSSLWKLDYNLDLVDVSKNESSRREESIPSNVLTKSSSNHKISRVYNSNFERNGLFDRSDIFSIKSAPFINSLPKSAPTEKQDRNNTQMEAINKQLAKWLFK